MRRAVLAFGLLTALAACDGEDPVDAALRDAAAARHAAAVKETGVAENPKAGLAPAVDCAAPTDGPACSSPREKIVSADERAWIEATLRDHRKALAEAKALLAESDNPAVRGAAGEVIATRKREIAQLEALRPEAGPAE